MENMWVNRFTLLPENPVMKNHVRKCSASKTQLLFLSIVMFALISIIVHFSFLMKNLSRSESCRTNLILLLTDFARVGFYAIVYFIRKVSKLLQSVIISCFPLLYSILITEIMVYVGNDETVLIRVLSGTSIFLVMTQHTLYNFIYTIIPFCLSYIYPFVRITCNLTPNSNRSFAFLCASANKHSAFEYHMRVLLASHYGGRHVRTVHKQGDEQAVGRNYEHA